MFGKPHLQISMSHHYILFQQFLCIVARVLINCKLYVVFLNCTRVTAVVFFNLRFFAKMIHVHVSKSFSFTNVAFAVFTLLIAS